MIRQRLTVRGVVQGVGFRPYIYVLARQHGLGGFVGNNSVGVFIEIEGTSEALNAFHRDLYVKLPPLARIESVNVAMLPPQGTTDFEIVLSESQPNASTLISPDIAICDECLRELFDPKNRRYHYPFINCTHCGPRFTIIQDVPYDRPLTTMRDFPMCEACSMEYHDPLDRRFHAQPNACPACGPKVWLWWGGYITEGEDEAILAARRLLAKGSILAVKGIGGFHLACDATSDAAIGELRTRKGRVDKPFALMASDLDVVRQFAEISESEAALLTNRERPIVLLRKKEESIISPLVAPGNAYVAVMLPYTPLHYLLIGETPLVMTSGNLSGDPIAYENKEALRRLGPLVDAFLMHNREIHIPCDDSVMRLFQGAELPIRRSRGYTPFPVKLPFALPPTLAVGAELKNTFCLTSDDHAFMSQHVGDMETLETLETFSHAVNHFQSLFRAEPEILVCDLHPRYLSSRWAHEEAESNHYRPRLVRVQHHHAHIAAVMAENGYDGTKPVIGVCFDGTGYGTDGAIWGGEVLIADYRGFRRAAHLKYVPLPGGDSAVKHPSRLALSHLWASGLDWDEALAPVSANSESERQVIRRELETGFNTVPTSSMGRLFDAVAALAGVRQTITYEAQAAIELESLAEEGITDEYPFDLTDVSCGPFIIDSAPLIRAVVADAQAGVAVGVISGRFHNTIAAMIAHIGLRLRQQEGLNVVALSGGVFQNVRLLALAVERLRADGFEVLLHRQVPPNDGGLALGQAMIGSQSAR